MKKNVPLYLALFIVFIIGTAFFWLISNKEKVTTKLYTFVYNCFYSINFKHTLKPTLQVNVFNKLFAGFLEFFPVLRVSCKRRSLFFNLNVKVNICFSFQGSGTAQIDHRLARFLRAFKENEKN